MLLNDLHELKLQLEIDPENTAEDAKLMLFLTLASEWVEEYLGYKLLRKERTEYYKGTGTQKLLLRSRPVFATPPIRVYVDRGGNHGSTAGAFAPGTLLEYGRDYCLDIDQDDGSSRSGILYRINGFWERPAVRQAGYLTPYVGPDIGSIKVVYTAGYTIDTLPGLIRQAVVGLVASMRYLLPLGMPLNSESYEERSISMSIDKSKEFLFSQVRPLLFTYRNWKW